MYRHNLKETNKKRYDEYLALQRERNKDYRQRVKADPEKLSEQKEKAKLRQRKFRENLKKKVANAELQECRTTPEKTKEKARTRAESSQKRKQWSESKRKYRATLSYQKKLWIRQRDKERKTNKKSLLKASPENGQTGYKSRKRLYNVTSQTRKSLPTTPQKFATVIKCLINNTTPRKRKATVDMMDFMKKQTIAKDTKHTMEDTTHHTLHTCNQEPEKTRKNLMTRIKQKYIQATPKTNILAKHFYMRGDISTPLPQKRYANKHGPGYVMQTTLIGAYRLFKKEHT